MLEVIDNVVSKTYQDQLEETFFGPVIPWNFNPTLTDDGYGQPGFGHDLIGFDGRRSEFYNYVLPLVYETSEKTGIKLCSIPTARAFLQCPSISERKNDYFHVDMTVDHKIFLYYINDSDGDTVISNRLRKDGDDPFLSDQDVEILEKVTPKKGRVVIFDGNLYHAAGVPKKNYRCILNFNIFDYDVNNQNT